MRRVLGPSRPKGSEAPVEERVDVAAVIARALNREEPPAPPAESPAASADPVEQVAPAAANAADTDADGALLSVPEVLSLPVADAPPAPPAAQPPPAAQAPPAAPPAPPVAEPAPVAPPPVSPLSPVPEVLSLPVADAPPAPPIAQPPPAAQAPAAAQAPPAAPPAPARPAAPPAATTPEEQAGAGATIRIPWDAPTDDDPLLAALIAMGKSAVYDLTSTLGAGHWGQIVVELPAAGHPDYTLHVADRQSPWQPSRHTVGTVEVLLVRIAETDPGIRYDVIVRPGELILCRWPHRAVDGHTPVPLEVPAETAEPAGDAARRRNRRRLGRHRRRS